MTLLVRVVSLAVGEEEKGGLRCEVGRLVGPRFDDSRNSEPGQIGIASARDHRVDSQAVPLGWAFEFEECGLGFERFEHDWDAGQAVGF